MWRLRSVTRRSLRQRLSRDRLWHWLCAIACLSLPFSALAESDFSIETSWAFDGQGRLWQASATHGQVILKVSEDKGKNFITVAPLVAGDGETAQVAHVTQLSRPQMVIDSADNIYIVWHKAARDTGQRLWFSRSVNAGASFEAPISIQEPAHALAQKTAHEINPSQLTPPPIAMAAVGGTLYLVWQGGQSDGAALYLAISHNHGKSFQPIQTVAASACPATKSAIAPKQTNGAALLWSHPFEAGTHDLAIAELDATSANLSLHRVTHSNWGTTACAGQPLALARGDQQGQSWGWHIAWQDQPNDLKNTDAKGRVAYVRMDGEAWVTSPVRRFGDVSQLSRQILLHSQGEQVWLAWQAHTTTGSQILGAESRDGGRSWSAPSLWMQSPGKGGSAQIVSDQMTPYLLWQTQDGLQVSRLGGE